MNTFLKNMELKKFFPAMTVVVLLLLTAIAALGIKQYLLYQHCQTMLTRSNQIIFQFTSIKEHISDSLISGKLFNIQETSQEILGFEKDLKKIIDDILIPEEFKLSFISQVDLMSLVVQLRAIGDNNAQSSQEQEAQLAASLRSISNRLLTFHNLLAEYTRTLFLGLYNVIIGTLALIIFFTTTILLLINKFLAIPIIRLCSTVDQTNEEERKNSPWKASTLTSSIQAITSFIDEQQIDKKRMERLRICLENLLQTLPDTFTSSDDWETLCSALQTNPDYFLVWIGQHGDDSRYPTAVTGCGCVSSSPSSCQQTIDHLIEFCHQEGSLCDTAKKAMQKGIPTTALCSYEELPQSLRHSLAIENQIIQSASFPISGREGTIDTVITLYSTDVKAFNTITSAVLQLLCACIANIRLQQPSVPSDMQHSHSQLYRFAVTGELSASIAYEMINLSNGALNYSQALIDLIPDDQEKHEEHLLLEKLHTEEEKISRLATNFSKLTTTEISGSQKFSFAILFNQTELLLRGKFRQKNIKLQTTIGNNIPEMQMPVGLLQLLLLTLLHHAEQYLTNRTATHGKEIHLKVMLIEDSVQLTITPIPPEITARDDANISPWPPITTCEKIAEEMNGELTFTQHAPSLHAAVLRFPLSLPR